MPVNGLIYVIRKMCVIKQMSVGAQAPNYIGFRRVRGSHTINGVRQGARPPNPQGGINPPNPQGGIFIIHASLRL